MKLTRRAASTTTFVVREYLTIWLVAAFGLALSLLAFTTLNQQLEAHRAVEFEWVAHNRYRALENGIWHGLDAVRGVADLFMLRPGLQQEDFELMAESVLSRTSGLEALIWAPRGPLESGSTWRSPPDEAPNLASIDQSRTDSVRDAADLGTHFPVRFIESVAAAPLPVGMNLASDPMIKDAFDRARVSGKTAVSGRLQLVKGGDPPFDFVAVHPVPSIPTSDDLKTAQTGPLDGFVVGLFFLPALAQAVIEPLEPRGVDCLIRDESGKPGEEFLDFYGSRLSAAELAPDEVSWRAQAVRLSSESFEVADRQWSVTCAATPGFRSAEAFATGPWVALAAGAFFTMLLTAYLVRSRQNMLHRLKMERALREREELFWQMTEMVSQVFWATTPDRSRFLYISPAFEQIWQVSCDELYRDPTLFHEPIHPEDRSVPKTALAQLHRTKRPVETVFRLQRDKGEDCWIRDRGFPVFDDTGSISHIVGFAEDITEERRAREALSKSEKQLRDLFNQSPDIILTVNREGRVLFINRSTPELPAELSIGRESVVLVPHDVQDTYRAALQRVFRTGDIDHFEFEKADATSWELRLVPLVHERSVMTAMIIVTDVTRNRHLQEQAARNARLASVGVLAAGVAHEINNPNNAIHFNISVLSRAWSDVAPILREYYSENGDFSIAGLPFSEASQTLPELLSQVAINSERIKNIVENLKQLSRKDQSELDFEVDVRTILSAAISVLRKQIQEHTDHFEVTVAEGLPTVRGSAQQLEQVSINVIHNALQALPDRNRGVFIEADSDAGSGMVSIRVRDEGEGISREHLATLTEPFFSTREASGGTGLGLSISQSIINRHGGRMKFDSEPGSGTTVTITLPTVDPGDKP